MICDTQLARVESSVIELILVSICRYQFDETLKK